MSIVKELCQDIYLSLVTSGTWDARTGTTCWAAFLQPQSPPGAAPPSQAHRQNDVLSQMLTLLELPTSPSNLNRASVNIAANGFPSQLFQGTQIDSGYDSWILEL